MATLQSGSSPGTRIEAGESVLQAAKTTSVKPVGKRFAAFRKAQAAYKNADAVVRRAVGALQAQQRKAGEADAETDVAVLDLASALAGDGLPRINPFKPMGFEAPAAICEKDQEVEAKLVLKLAAAIAKRPGLSNKSRAAAKVAAAKANAVLAALKPIAKLDKARKDAIARRDALALPWEKAFAALKRGASAARDEGADGLYEALFDRAPARPAKKGAQAAKAEAAIAAAPDAGAIVLDGAPAA